MINHFLSTDQFNEPSDLDPFFAHADLMASPYKNFDPIYLLRGKILGLVFLDKSTRTKISFDVAIKKLGGQTFDFNSDTSSIQKGESLQDTLNVLRSYADALIIRNREHEIIEEVAKMSSIPIINAGSHEHPVQAITDLYTIRKEIGKLHGLNILLIGDLKYSRTIASLINLLKLYKNVRIHLHSPDELKLPNHLFYNNIIYTEEKNISSILPKVDVVYITRLQKEIYPDGLYDVVQNKYFFGEKDIVSLRKDAIIMHPLPRNNELSHKIDADKRSAYFRQSHYGIYVKMGVLQQLFKKCL